LNKYKVCVAGQAIVIQLPPFIVSEKKDALNLEAWLVALAETEDDELEKILGAIKNA
jgi:hypothetical protein